LFVFQFVILKFIVVKKKTNLLLLKKKRIFGDF
jgi:hypothetical protein